MKRFFIVLVVPILFVTCNNQQARDDSGFSSAQVLVDSLSKEFIPDARDDIRMLSVEMHNGILELKGMTNRRDLHSAVVDHLQGEFTVKDKSLLLPDHALGGDTFALVKNSVANLRSEPRHSAQLSTQALMGMPLKVYYEQDGWFLVRTIENYIAWVDKDGLIAMDEIAFKEWQRSNRLVFTAISGEAYTSSSMSAASTDLVFGDVVQLVEAGNPTHIRLPDGRLAYANAGDLQDLKTWTEEVAMNAENTLQFAQELMGRPYLWGGTSIYGMDCSGYTKTIFLKRGIIIPRDASQQVKAGEEILLDDNLSQLIEGDLIFFGDTREDGTHRITHVGIYMGDGRIIHAAGRVKIESLKPSDSLFNKMRYETMLEARRYIGMEEAEGLLPLSESMYYK